MLQHVAESQLWHRRFAARPRVQAACGVRILAIAEQLLCCLRPPVDLAPAIPVSSCTVT